MARRIAGAGLSLLLIATTLHAQGRVDYNQVRKVQFGIGGGAIVPRTKARFQDVMTGATGQAYLLLRPITGFPAIRIGADFARMTFATPTQTVNDADLGVNRTQLGGVASLRFDLMPGPVRPYVLAGVGAFNIRDLIDPDGGGANVTQAVTRLGLDGGAGVSFRMGRISGFVETRIQNVYTKDGGMINTKSISAFPVTFGLVF